MPPALCIPLDGATCLLVHFLLEAGRKTVDKESHVIRLMSVSSAQTGPRHVDLSAFFSVCDMHVDIDRKGLPAERVAEGEQGVTR